MFQYRYGIWLTATLVLLGAAASGNASAQTCAIEVGQLVSVEGIVEVQQTGAGGWQRSALDSVMCQGDTVRVGARSRAAIALVNDAVLRIDENTTMRLTNIVREPEKRSILSLITGVFQSFSRKPRRLEVNTAYLNGSIEGTEFVIERHGDKASLTVLEGRVIASNSRGRVTVTGGQVAQATKDTAPVRRIVARPRDAVQWGLYYPPVLSGAGDTASPAGRAAQLLNVGRVDEARAEIDRAIAGNSNAALAHALRAIINVVQNRNDDAFTDAQRAVKLAPRSAAAKIALSYAQQARFDLPAALVSMLDAVKAEPRNALAWARLSELHLSLGQRGDSSDAAVRAVELAPGIARTHTVLGYAALVELDTTAAVKSFQEAIKLSSSTPLPRLGLGLAKIKRGDLEAGRHEIDIAVGLDSSNALLRSYLGKAYFEEKRSPLDAQQLAIAKELDPKDPTPWLYDALRKQTENRPGEALKDLQQSIAKNDNRAVYRGRLQLDQDRAARGASLARIYKDLGFNQLGLLEATNSLSLNPGNASAHRFLSDSYGTVRRREIARVSELLQAQLLQDININPVQPSISDSNLNIVTGGGPTQAGFNEFTPLFERNRVQFNVSGEAGNYDTYGGEAVLSAVVNRFSASAGTFSHKTEGYRDNHDIEHDIHNMYLQGAVTPDLNIQLEGRRRNSDSGDLALNFNPDQFKREFNRHLRADMGRVGIRYSPTPSSKILASYIRTDRDERQSDVVPTAFGAGASVADSDSDGDQVDVQYMYQTNPLSVVAGVAWANTNVNTSINVNLINAFPGFDLAPPVLLCPPFCVGALPAGTSIIAANVRQDLLHRRAYVYVSTKLPEAVTWTVGGSYDDYEQESFTLNKRNYKLGVQWMVNEDLRLRAAAFRVVKPVVSANMTLEPTQIAGFNQWFDDVNGSVSRAYAIGADWRGPNRFYLGAEATRRHYEDVITSSSSGGSTQEPRDETMFRFYTYWVPVPTVALSGALIYDRFDADPSIDIPRRVNTLSVPLTVRYFSPSGLFAHAGLTYVDQKVHRDASTAFEFGKSDFVTVDVGIGYRLPNRRGIIGLQVVNLFDENFNYQDDGFREFRDNPTAGPYFPDRLITLRGSLNF